MLKPLLLGLRRSSDHLRGTHEPCQCVPPPSLPRPSPCDIASNKTQTPSDQPQKYEDSVPGNLEFKRLKEHLEPFIRAPFAPSPAPHLRTTQHIHVDPITAAASDFLSQDVPGVNMYSSLSHRQVGRDKPKRDEMPEYRNRMDILD